MEKVLKKEEKKRTVEETHAKEETATCFIEEYCACKATDTLNEDVTIPHQKIKGQPPVQFCVKSLPVQPHIKSPQHQVQHHHQTQT